MLINQKALEAHTMGMDDLKVEVLEIFQQHARVLYDHLMTSQSPKEWHLAAHTLKGSARSVGADQVAIMARELENMTPLPQLSERKQFLGALKNMIDTTNLHIDQLLEK